MTTLRKAARQEHQLLVARSVRPSLWGSITCRHHGQHTMIRFLLFAAAAARAVADLHALAPVTREERAWSLKGWKLNASRPSASKPSD